MGLKRVKLICPKCAKGLGVNNDGGLICPACETTFRLCYVSDGSLGLEYESEMPREFQTTAKRGF